MLKLDYSFTAVTPIHTGSDTKMGTEKQLRREKIKLKTPILYTSKFQSEEIKRDCIIKILLHIWKCIDFKSMEKTRLVRIWDEFTGKVIASTRVKTKEEFLNLLTHKMEIRSLVNDNSENLTDLLERFNDYEFLDTVRNETQYLILKMKTLTKKSETANLPLFDNNKSVEDIELLQKVRNFEYLPIISGNTIRGPLRRVVMRDFRKRVDFGRYDERNKPILDKSVYNQLYTGGNITDSSGKESIENREKMIAMCPMIGLLGSAIGNQTITGELNVTGARPKCSELGTGNVSFWELIDVVFLTRSDSSKTEKEIIIYNDMKDVTTQMMFQYETFVVGTEFEANFTLRHEDNTLMTSAFWHMMTLFKENPYVGGNSARDCGLIDLSNLQIPEGANKFYLDYLEEKKEEIKAYFTSDLALSLA